MRHFAKVMRLTAVAGATALLAHFTVVQATMARQDVQSAVVEHSSSNGTATVSCNRPDALQDALRAVRQQYGWVVNFEKPAYFSSYDLVDDTAPEWRLKHPQAKGVTRTAGGQFAA